MPAAPERRRDRFFKLLKFRANGHTTLLYVLHFIYVGLNNYGVALY